MVQNWHGKEERGDPFQSSACTIIAVIIKAMSNHFLQERLNKNKRCLTQELSLHIYYLNCWICCVLFSSNCYLPQY